MLELVKDYYEKRNGYELKLMCTLNMLIYYLLYYILSEEVVEDRLIAEKINLERLSRLIDYINDNYMNKPSLKSLASREIMDMYYLSHFIKKQLGISFQEYINKKRMEKAIELLIKTKLRSTDICIESVFSDYRYLCKTFKQEYGCTPAQYKQLYKTLKPVVTALDNREEHRYIEQYEAFQKLLDYTNN